MLGLEVLKVFILACQINGGALVSIADVDLYQKACVNKLIDCYAAKFPLVPPPIKSMEKGVWPGDAKDCVRAR